MIFFHWLITIFFLSIVGITVLFANFLQMLSLLILPFHPHAFRKINRFIADSWFGILRWTIEVPLRIKVLTTGDTLPWQENAFVIANHQAMADIPILGCVAHPSGRKGDFKWFVKDPIKWVPGVGWGLLFLDCLFVKRNWTADKNKVIEIFKKIRTNNIPFWVISFLEGTRSTPQKILKSQAFAKKQNLPPLRHVLLPRTKGFEATLDGLGDKIQAIYDITIAYEGSAPSLLKFFFYPTKIYVHKRRYTTWPQENSARAAWALERFQEKDKLLDFFKNRGRFPNAGES